jgi:hypothetical protein
MPNLSELSGAAESFASLHSKNNDFLPFTFGAVISSSVSSETNQFGRFIFIAVSLIITADSGAEYE